MLLDVCLREERPTNEFCVFRPEDYSDDILEGFSRFYYYPIGKTHHWPKFICTKHAVDMFNYAFALLDAKIKARTLTTLFTEEEKRKLSNYINKERKFLWIFRCDVSGFDRSTKERSMLLKYFEAQLDFLIHSHMRNTHAYIAREDTRGNQQKLMCFHDLQDLKEGKVNDLLPYCDLDIL